MNAQKLFNALMAKRQEIIPSKDFAPIQKAVLEELCEKVAIADGIGDFNDDQKIVLVLQTLEAAFPAMLATIKAALDTADTVTINYRDRTFTFDRNSPIYQDQLTDKSNEKN